MARRSKLKRAVSLAGPGVQVHDRRATDLTINAQVAPVEVVDPFGDRIVVMQNLRDDPLFGMRARCQIDQAQYDGGRKWQKYMEDCEVGNIRAIDPSKEAVDGGRCPEPLSAQAAFAFQELKKASRELGQIDESIVRDVLMHRLTFVQICVKRDMTKKGDPDHIGKRFREALNVLAVVFGCTGRGPAPKVHIGNPREGRVER